MLPDYWLDLHTYHKECGSNLSRELGNLLRCDANNSMELFVENDFPSWNPLICGTQKN